MVVKVLPETVFNPVCVVGVDLNGNYRVALVNTQNQLVVSGEDQVFSYAGQLMGVTHDPDSGVGSVLVYSGDVPMGEVWVVTQIYANNQSRGMEDMQFVVRQSGNGDIFRVKTGSTPDTLHGFTWTGEIFLAGGDDMYVKFATCVGGDQLEFSWFGYTMTLAL